MEELNKSIIKEKSILKYPIIPFAMNRTIVSIIVRTIIVIRAVWTPLPEPNLKIKGNMKI